MAQFTDFRPATPEVNSNASSGDEFFSARGSQASSKHSTPSAVDISPGTKDNPIRLVDYSDSDLSFSSSDEDTTERILEIPAPPTRDDDGRLIKWDSLDAAFEALQALASPHITPVSLLPHVTSRRFCSGRLAPGSISAQGRLGQLTLFWLRHVRAKPKAKN
ncbi:uncharacterized protein Z518_10208 [Rhinocladiella mackenziei CBS 650.93]|uniref:Rhinocladiella mackenziei CBS 650.93 unplaced genomic scaffold supercont1.8, whole genome shotgun sequence n=1 Tax=Rhinocladiella mackenziei CBS 650.93 TaxID=1442369 RepID=A0A0D2FGL4_9EURO|nr:uncharacterized protein Z518_10208 [Rhinocladiella mackenziei CBS 650.93]KIX01142.1 hypothetical protein Z518_10208 [Rhinocladiella mackenziei CBS 650.93]